MTKKKMVPVVYLKGHNEPVEGLAFSSDSRYALSGGQDMILWGIQAKEVLKIFQGHKANIWSCAFSPDDQFALSGSVDETIKLWDISTGKEIRTLKGHRSWVKKAIFSNDGKQIASISWNGTMTIWSTNTGEQVHVSKFKNKICDIAYSNGGQCIAVGNCEGELTLLDLISKEIIWVNKFYDGGGVHVSFSPRINRAVLTSGASEIVILIEFPSGKILEKFKLDDYGADGGIGFNSDGNKIYVTTNFTIQTWDIVNAKLLKSITTGEGDLIENAAFSPDDHWALTGNAYKELILWDLTI
ncbi:MAG: hypothetical protein NTY09_13805 [bacterium]|nr:hypothetical protein [bacterium]